MSEPLFPYQASVIGDKSYLDKVEKTYRGYIEYGRKNGYVTAPKFLEHYLDGTGKPIKLEYKEARDLEFIKNAEQTNQKRFETSIANNSQSISKKIARLKPGESVSFNDNWDYIVSSENLNPSRNIIISDGLDGFLTFGKTSINSVGNFTAKREKNVVKIDGEIKHSWKDKYDFDPSRLAAAGVVVLEKVGRAKSFDFGSEWKQKLEGRMHIKNGHLLNPEFQWKNLND